MDPSIGNFSTAKDTFKIDEDDFDGDSGISSVFRENIGQIPIPRFHEHVDYYATFPWGMVGFSISRVFFAMNRSFIQLEFPDANLIQPSGGNQLQGYSNYFCGNHSFTEIKHFAQIVYNNLYEGITLCYSITSQGLKYKFRVNPRADINLIKMAYTGADNINVMPTKVEVTINDFKFIDDKLDVFYSDNGQQIISTFTERVILDENVSNHHTQRKIIQFSLDSNYDSSRPIVIDPLFLAYSTFLGGYDEDHSQAITLDDANNVYLTGGTGTNVFPIVNAYNDTYGGGELDVFVSKLSADGSTLIYSTFIGGKASDEGYAITLDDSNNIYITGYTGSMDFPIINAYNATYGGGDRDVFVCKLSADGSTLLYSTFIGGRDEEISRGLVLDETNNIYITGFTWSNDYPTMNPYNATYGGGENDVFVSKFSADGSTLIYSTFIGGSGSDHGNAIALDSSNNIYVMGYTASSNFPTVNAYNSTYGGGSHDAFVCKISAVGSTLEFSTFIGGNESDYGEAIVLDSENNIYITGVTLSRDFPTVNAYNATFIGGGYDVFMSRFSTDGSTLIFSSYFGGSDTDYSFGISLDDVNNIYLTGCTYSRDFPTVNAYDNDLNGQLSDIFVSKLSANYSTLLFSTYLGGYDEDLSRAIVLDSANNVYVTGRTWSPDFPTVNAYDSIGECRTYSSDVFVCKIVEDDIPFDSTLSKTPTHPESSSVPSGPTIPTTTTESLSSPFLDFLSILILCGIMTILRYRVRRT